MDKAGGVGVGWVIGGLPVVHFFSVMKSGDAVSVFSDLEGRCTRGAKEFPGKRVFLGNGVAEMDRTSIFRSNEPVK